MTVKSPKQKLLAIAEACDLSPDHVQEVYDLITAEGAFTPGVILQELRWFYVDLGLARYYFDTTPVDFIAKHLQALYAAKILKRTSGEEDLDVYLESEHEDIALYVCRSEHPVSIKIERRIEEKYPDYRLQSYRTTGTLSPDDPESFLRFYFLTSPDLPSLEGENPTLEEAACPTFLSSTQPQTLERYRTIFQKVTRNLGPVIQISDKPETNEKRLSIGYEYGSTHSYFSAISDVLYHYGIHSNRKYIEHFSNGTTIFNLYVNSTFDDETIHNIREAVSLVYVLPRTSLTPLFREAKLSAQEVVYAYAGWKFVHQFLTRYNQEYVSLSLAFKDDPVGLGLLNQFKHRLAKDTFTEGRICEAIFQYSSLIKELYKDFEDYHLRAPHKEPQDFNALHNEELITQIKKGVSSEVDRQILTQFLTFNRHVTRTNFYKDTKVALAFRLDPSFLSTIDYPDTPYVIYFMVGSEFRGFHIRFRDVARGGIRIIRSNNAQAFARNIDSLFAENYDLAHTQQKKNKDIPEGGSKGTILLSLEHQTKAEVAFKKYVDCLLDLILPNEEIVNHDNKQEILFLGPDEGTAELMDWASQHARRRGNPFWKAFSTGKSIEMGGIPHDLYGMTTRSVHQYVVGILEKLNIDEEDVTKIQTGGPDGDLGSNEIKISKDRTLTIIDGSGVLHDPNGIDREELLRLARSRKMCEEFNRSKLSPDGFFVHIKDRDIQLPDGTIVESGLHLRNNFHLNPASSAQLFVPCGGRPEAVHINNVHHLFDGEKKPRFSWIVEGANLFFTQEARLELEKAGVIFFKDASANKGGVTSSSLEVLAALSFDDEPFRKHMEVHSGQIPEFYQSYIQEVHKRIKENAAAEFECLWRSHETTGTPRSVLTDQLSDKINALNDQIQQSSLWQNKTLRRRVLQQALPNILLEMIGQETLVQRIPQNYLRAIFGSYLASRYIYKYGLEANEIQFIEFIGNYLHDDEEAA